jgi:hypothetical protein
VLAVTATKKKSVGVLLAVVLSAPWAAGCKKKVSQADCDRMIDRFAELVVKERIKDAPPETIKAEQDRERKEARGDEAFRNCTSEVSPEDYACAMRTATSDQCLKCLE